MAWGPGCIGLRALLAYAAERLTRLTHKMLK